MVWFIIFCILTVGMLALSRLPLKAMMDARGARYARHKGTPPLNGKKATLFDVKRLIIIDEIDAAVQLYSEIYRVSRKQAVTEVEQLSASIRQKNSEKD